MPIAVELGLRLRNRFFEQRHEIRPGYLAR